MRKAFAAVSALALVTAGGSAVAAVNVTQDLTTFNTNAGSPPIVINFDSLSGNLAGTTISGVTFTSPPGNTLEVVPAASTVSVLGGPSHTLSATSGANLLSPGGATMPGGPALGEMDSLQLDFANPLTAFGLDILFESLDCCSFMTYAIFGPGNVPLTSGSINTSGAGTGSGSVFFGVSATGGDAISRILFSETDSDSTNPDANAGYDSFRFFAAAPSIPEPASWVMMLAGFGILGMALRFGKRPAEPTAA